MLGRTQGYTEAMLADFLRRGALADVRLYGDAESRLAFRGRGQIPHL